MTWPWAIIWGAPLALLWGLALRGGGWKLPGGGGIETGLTYRRPLPRPNRRRSCETRRTFLDQDLHARAVERGQA